MDLNQFGIDFDGGRPGRAPVTKATKEGPIGVEPMQQTSNLKGQIVGGRYLNRSI